MTALPSEPWVTGTADDDTEEACVSCGVGFTRREGWDGECLGCAVLAEEHRDGRHAAAVVAECRRCC